MIKRLLFPLFIFLLLLSGCSPARVNEAAMPAAGAPPQTAMEMPAGDTYVTSNFGSENDKGILSQDSTQGNAAENRLVIRNATLTILVDDPSRALIAIIHMAEEMDGFVVTSNLYKTSPRQGQEYPAANINVRVPAERLNDALTQIKALVADPENDIQSENVTGQDVTKEYTDLQSKLTNLESTEAQLREIMASATKTEDVLAVYSQLTQVREQIEVLKGQIKYYEESAAMSSIAVQINALASVQPLEIGGWRPVGVARDAAQALIDALQFLGSAVIWLVIFFVPIGLLIFLPLRLLWGLFRRNRKPRMQAPPPSSPPAPQNPA